MRQGVAMAPMNNINHKGSDAEPMGSREIVRDCIKSLADSL